MTLSAIQIVGSVPASQIQQWIWLGLRNHLAMQLADCAGNDTLWPMDRPADDADIRQTLAGDGDAYRRLVERHQQEIAKRLRRFSRDPNVLSELVQNTFVEAYFGLEKFRGDAPFIHWLHRIAVRVGHRFWKARKSQTNTSQLEDLDVAAEKTAAADTAAKEEIELVLRKLSPRDRLVITLMYLEDHGVEETARLTGWSTTMVKVQAFRARRKLRKIMKEGGQ